MKKIILALCLSALLSACIHTQTIYVDAVNGKDGASGTITAPMLNLETAITTANNFTW